MRGSKGILGLVMLLTIALVASVPAGSAAGTGGDNAAAAKKKKCKKKKPHAAKKKKCKKKKKQQTVAPIVRATLNWSNGGADDVDMDLFVFDASGQRAGNGSDAIPSSTLSPDVTGPAGSETFTDLAFNLHRPLSFGVCYQVGGSVHTDFTITYITADGVSHTETRADDGNPPSPGSSGH
ncbi:MAG TPA: hypothetical protein VGE91_00615, partial [Solirubrobacterales bacterium]